MSKAYVIKNKEGEYLSNKPYIFTKQLLKARLYINKTNVDKEIHRFKDCTIVPITICECDLEEENRVLKKALELACERVKYFEEMQDKEMGHFEIFGHDIEYDLQAIIEEYIQQAKE